ncbi:MAG: LLM class flavin-dependent oxidoreductase [Alphaproteobacteria bacterium]|nr:LLM class flavin-dependent oxidoreductase [Alphaproteobacteria bacterium]
MQIGLRIGPQNEFTPVPEYLKFVKRAEALGFDPLLFSDTVSLSHFHLRDPFVVMALTAGVTERAGLGTGVTVPFTRHPAVIANAFGSIDDAIAPRRTFLGIGSGDTAVYLIGKRAARLREMRAYLQVLRGLLNGEPVTFEGARMQSNWRKPHIPICLAADGPKMLAVAGELADEVILGAGATPEVIDWARGCIAEGEVRGGRAPGSVPVWVDLIVSVGDDREAVRRAIRPRLCNRANHNFRMGFYSVPEEHLPGVRAFRENYDESDVGSKTKNADRITDYIIDRFAFVGTTSDVVARFESLHAMGVDKVIVAMPFRLDERYEIIETLARHVMPRVSGAAG